MKAENREGQHVRIAQCALAENNLQDPALEGSKGRRYRSPSSRAFYTLDTLRLLLLPIYFVVFEPLYLGFALIE